MKKKRSRRLRALFIYRNESKLKNSKSMAKGKNKKKFDSSISLFLFLFFFTWVEKSHFLLIFSDTLLNRLSIHFLLYSNIFYLLFYPIKILYSFFILLLLFSKWDGGERGEMKY